MIGSSSCSIPNPSTSSSVSQCFIRGAGAAARIISTVALLASLVEGICQFFEWNRLAGFDAGINLLNTRNQKLRRALLFIDIEHTVLVGIQARQKATRVESAPAATVASATSAAIASAAIAPTAWDAAAKTTRSAAAAKTARSAATGSARHRENRRGLRRQGIRRRGLHRPGIHLGVGPKRSQSSTGRAQTGPVIVGFSFRFNLSTVAKFRVRADPSLLPKARETGRTSCICRDFRAILMLNHRDSEALRTVRFPRLRHSSARSCHDDANQHTKVVDFCEFGSASQSILAADLWNSDCTSVPAVPPTKNHGGPSCLTG